MQTKLYKIPKFGVNRPNSNVIIYNGMYGHPGAIETASEWPHISLLILRFLNHSISVKTGLINTKLGDFVNLGVLFLTMWSNSRLSDNLQTRT